MSDENRDPGDEDLRPLPGGECVFCREHLGNIRRGSYNLHRFPLRPDDELFGFCGTFEEALALKDKLPAYSTLDTCNKPECVAQGRAFVEQHNTSPMKKERRRFEARLREKGWL